MTKATLLLLLVAAASTIVNAVTTTTEKLPVVAVEKSAVPEPPAVVEDVKEDEPVEQVDSRTRRTTDSAPSGRNGASSAGASSFSGSFSGSGSGGGKTAYSGTQGSPRGAFDASSQGYIPDYSNFGNYYPFYPFQNAFPIHNPYNFQQAYQQHLQQMQRLAQQHQAYAPNNYFGPNLDSNGIDYSSNPSGPAGYGSSSSFSGSGSGAFGGGYGQPSGGFGQPNGGFASGSYGQPSGGFGQQFGGYGQQPAGGYGQAPGNDEPSIRFGSGNYDGPGDSVGAAAVANISPRGGFGSANLYPDLGTRMGGEFPAPNGQNFGVFTSSSSGSSDVDGVKKSFKTSTSGVNDNGKITSYTVHDP